MANGLTKATEGFALGMLGQAAGQDFLGPSLDAQRQKDLFAFQQKEANRLREERRKQDREERRASRRGLVNALQATGAIRPEDVVAAGGMDVLADLEDSEFTMLTARLGDEQMQRLQDKDLIAAVNGMLAAQGKPLMGPDATRTQAIELKANIDMERLMAEERKQTRQEAGRAVDMRMRQGARDIQDLFRNPQAVSNQTLVQAFGRHQQMAAQLSAAAGDLDEDQYEAAIGELNSLANTIRGYQEDAALNALASQSPPQIISAFAQLEPHQRAAALERPRISAAWDRVSASAQTLVGLGEEGAAKIGMGDLREAIINGDLETDGNLAGRLFAEAGKIAEGPRLVKQAEAVERGRAKAVQAAETVRVSGFAAEVDPTTFVDDEGNFNEEGYQRAVYTDAVMSADELEPEAALDLLNRLGGAPSDLQRLAAKQAQRAIDRKVASTRPSALFPAELMRAEVEVEEDAAHAALDAVLAEPIAEVPFEPTAGRIAKDTAIDIATFTLSRPFRTSFHEEPDVMAPSHLGKLRSAVAQTALPLERQEAALNQWAETLKGEVRAADPELRPMYEESLAEVQETALVVNTRNRARGAATTMLKAASPALSQIQTSSGGTSTETGAALLRAFGRGEEEAMEGAADVNTPEGVMTALRDGMLAEMKAAGVPTREAGEAVAAELDRLVEIASRLEAHLAEPETLERYRRAGIVKGQAADMPALELLAYLL